MNVNTDKTITLDAGNFKLSMGAKVFFNDPPVNNTLLFVSIYSDGFSGNMTMDVGSSDVESFTKQLTAMNDVVKGSAKIKETYGDGYIEMEMDRTGHVIVRGFVYDSFQKLSFDNRFELSYLDSFVKALANTEEWQVTE